MQIRVCDRCRTQVPDLPAQLYTRGVTVVAGSPASAPVTADVDVTLAVAVAAPGDLCGPCRMSAVIEYAAAELVAYYVATADLAGAKALVARFVTMARAAK